MLFRTPLLLAALAALLASPAWGDDAADRARARAQEGRILPLARILQMIEPLHPGEVLEVELDDDDDPEYEIRILKPNGRIVELDIDARTGRILDIDEDD